MTVELGAQLAAKSHRRNMRPPLVRPSDAQLAGLVRADHVVLCAAGRALRLENNENYRSRQILRYRWEKKTHPLY